MNNRLQKLGFTPLAGLLVVGWMLVMIAVPIAIWTIGLEAVPSMMLVATLCQATAVFVLLWQAWGAKYALTTLFAVGVMGWLLEAIGTATGFPFGTYDYTNKLQPQLAHVPLLIPLAWFMMLPVSWAVASLLGRGTRPWWRFILLSALAMTAWDLFLDPQMVMWEFWLWRDVPSFNYFGIPWQNYFGWLLGAGGITAVVYWLIRPPWQKIPHLPLLIIYSIVWFLQTFGLLFFWGMVGPALVGGLVMGGMMLLAWRAMSNEQ
jgi:lycopene beta-cyclase